MYRFQRFLPDLILMITVVGVLTFALIKQAEQIDDLTKRYLDLRLKLNDCGYELMEKR